MKVDAHQHFWVYDPVEFAWIDDRMATIRQSFLPADLKPSLDAAGYAGCVAVQAPQTLEETKFLCRLAEENPWILGVVGWANLFEPEVELPKHPKLKGLRHILQGQPIALFFDTTFRKNIARLAEHGLTYDILIYHDQLDEATDLAWTFEDVRFVLDHIAKPRIIESQWQPWARKIKKLSRQKNVYVKLSGMAFEADWSHWDKWTLKKYIDHVVGCFGPERCMIGSDWPVSLCAGDYARTMGTIEECLDMILIPREMEQVLGKTAIEFYGLA